MKKLIALLLMGPLLAQARGPLPLVLAPGASPSEFKEFLLRSPDKQSYVAYKELQKNQTSEKIYEIADHLSKPPEQVLALVKQGLSGYEQSDDSLVFFSEVLERVNLNKLTLDEKRDWNHLACQVLVLKHNEARPSCRTSKISTRELQKLFPWADAIRIENRWIRFAKDTDIHYLPTAAYHFELASNTHEGVTYWGRLSQLKEQRWSPSTWISGSCEGFSSEVRDFDMTETGGVYFNKNCVRSLKEPQKSLQGWVSRNKSFIAGASLIAVGILAYSLRNKELVVEGSAFK